MTRKEKLIQRLKSKPKDFTWNKLTSLLTGLGFTEVKTGKTGGSRRRFVNADNVVLKILNQSSLSRVASISELAAIFIDEPLLQPNKRESI